MLILKQQNIKDTLASARLKIQNNIYIYAFASSKVGEIIYLKFSCCKKVGKGFSTKSRRFFIRQREPYSILRNQIFLFNYLCIPWVGYCPFVPMYLNMCGFWINYDKKNCHDLGADNGLDCSFHSPAYLRPVSLCSSSDPPVPTSI